MSRWRAHWNSAYSRHPRCKQQHSSRRDHFELTMQTRTTVADTQVSSLDRTDVLPVLDVEAYEATLVESQKNLSRTDTWTVEALRDIDEIVESASHQAPTEVRSINVARTAPAPEAFTVNIDRILKRIADLEADIVKAQDANALLLKRNDALQAERDQHAARIEALASEGARLAEQMAQRTEKQLREELQRREVQLKDLQDNHAKTVTMSERTLSTEKARAA